VGLQNLIIIYEINKASGWNDAALIEFRGAFSDQEPLIFAP
jgi:hypothetical protein